MPEFWGGIVCLAAVVEIERSDNLVSTIRTPTRVYVYIRKVMIGKDVNTRRTERLQKARLTCSACCSDCRPLALAAATSH